MIVQESVDAIEKAGRFTNELRRPVYDSFSFSNLVPLIKQLLLKETPTSFPKISLHQNWNQTKKIVLILLDGFGWRFYNQFIDHPLLEKLTQKGQVSKISSQFPSTTAAHVTTLHTGHQPSSSGVFEWYFYHPKLDNIISPLVYSIGTTGERNSLNTLCPNATDVFPKDTIYQFLQKHKITTKIAIHQNYFPCTANEALLGGAEILGYDSLNQGFTTLLAQIQTSKERSYFLLYFDKLDTICHKYGVTSPEFKKEVLNTLDMLQELLITPLEKENKNDTLIFITADHGLEEINPNETLYINELYPQLEDQLRKNKQNELLVPGGSCRDMFLYVKPDQIQKVQSQLKSILENKADVFLVDDLMDQGFFGQTTIDPELRPRFGEVVILPYDNQTVWWKHPNIKPISYLAHHGGLSSHEMESVLISHMV